MTVRAARPILFRNEIFNRDIGYFEVKIVKSNYWWVHYEYLLFFLTSVLFQWCCCWYMWQWFPFEWRIVGRIGKFVRNLFSLRHLYWAKLYSSHWREIWHRRCDWLRSGNVGIASVFAYHVKLISIWPLFTQEGFFFEH